MWDVDVEPRRAAHLAVHPVALHPVALLPVALPGEHGGNHGERREVKYGVKKKKQKQGVLAAFSSLCWR